MPLAAASTRRALPDTTSHPPSLQKHPRFLLVGRTIAATSCSKPQAKPLQPSIASRPNADRGRLQPYPVSLVRNDDQVDVRRRVQSKLSVLTSNGRRVPSKLSVLTSNGRRRVPAVSPIPSFSVHLFGSSTRDLRVRQSGILQYAHNKTGIRFSALHFCSRIQHALEIRPVQYQCLQIPVAGGKFSRSYDADQLRVKHSTIFQFGRPELPA